MNAEQVSVLCDAILDYLTRKASARLVEAERSSNEQHAQVQVVGDALSSVQLLPVSISE